MDLSLRRRADIMLWVSWKERLVKMSKAVSAEPTFISEVSIEYEENLASS